MSFVTVICVRPTQLGRRQYRVYRVQSESRDRFELGVSAPNRGKPNHHDVAHLSSLYDAEDMRAAALCLRFGVCNCMV